MFEANCSRQMGQHKKNLLPNVFVFTWGLTKARIYVVACLWVPMFDQLMTPLCIHVNIVCFGVSC